MIDNQEPITEKHAAQPTTGKGCAIVAVFLIGFVWVVISVAIYQLLSWTMEQTLFEISYNMPDFRWLISLGYAAGIALPMMALYNIFKSPRSKLAFRVWMMAGFFALVLVPAKLLPLTNALDTALLQLGGIAIYLFGVKYWLDSHPAGADRLPKFGLRGWGLAMLGAAAVAVPWILNGALGSIEDLLLNIMVGLLFGAAAEITLFYGFLFATQAEGRSYRPADLVVDGFVAAIALVIMATGLGQTGTQSLLPLGAAGLGWAAVGFNYYSRRKPSQMSWGSPALLLGLAAVWVLIFFDPDELALVISGGVGETLEYAFNAGWTSLALGFGLSVLTFMYFLRWVDWELPRWVSPAVGAVGAGIILGVYLLWGKAGFFGEKLFLVFSSQADLTSAASISDLAERRSAVYSTLTAHAEQEQARIRAVLDRFGITYTPYYLVNGMEVRGGSALRWWLESQPEIDRVLDNPVLRPLREEIPMSSGTDTAPSAEPAWNLSLIGADRVWNELGVKGEGILIGQSDSGADGQHPELAASYRGGQDSWLDPWFQTKTPTDIGGHGTHTLGTILGENVGVAPGANWIGCVNLGRNLGNPALYLDCMQFMLAPYPQGGNAFTDGDAARGANVLNNSWGCPSIEGCDPQVFEPAVQALRTAGIFVVASAGNSGYAGCGSVSDPIAIYSEVFTVGAINQAGSITNFSSLGPVVIDGSQRLKPDLVAPGEDILSAFPGNTYSILSGTSMAGPHVAGVVALMWSANPALIGDIERTEEILEQTAKKYEGVYPECVPLGQTPNAAVGYGVVDAFAAVKAAQALK